MEKQTLREAMLNVVSGREPHEIFTVKELRDILARFPKPSGPTVRVRIAVGVRPGGEWAALGGSMWSNAEDAAYELEDYSQYRFVEADVPLPVAETIEGTVLP